VKGIIFRIGVRIKDFGEWLAHVPVVRIFAPRVKSAGLAIKDIAFRMNVEGM
jgi:hypothetical protein